MARKRSPVLCAEVVEPFALLRQGCTTVHDHFSENNSATVSFKGCFYLMAACS